MSGFLLRPCYIEMFSCLFLMPILQLSLHSIFYNFIYASINILSLLFLLLTFLIPQPSSPSFPFLLLLLHCPPILLFYHLLSVTFNSVPSLSHCSQHCLTGSLPLHPVHSRPVLSIMYVAYPEFPRTSYRPSSVLDWGLQILVSLHVGVLSRGP